MNAELPPLLHLWRIQLIRLPRRVKQGIMLSADAVGWIASVLLATLLVDGQLGSVGATLLQIALATLICTPIAAAFGLYRSIVRFIGADIYAAAMKTGVVAAASMFGLQATLSFVASPLRWSIVFGAGAVIYLTSSRFLARSFLNKRHRRSERVLIYGAGAAGARLANALSAADRYLPIAFVDDDLSLKSRVVHGLEVHASDSIEPLCTAHDARTILLAMPSISRRRRAAILRRLAELPVHIQMMPEISDLVSGRARVDDIRDVEVEDLLGRDAVPPDPELLHACIRGKIVMVTGAGGSIGGELCRQILALEPKALLLFEISEAALYEIDRQLCKLDRRHKFDVEIVPLLGSVHHRERVLQIMTEFGVQTVYHAAAYKHVPMVERNLVEGVHNNVFGTLHTARAAVEAGVETFVLVSTDKAVSPTNVMGATKRFAELVLQALHEREHATKFCMVRFGNVLASSGSVVPLFREQIRAGGPITVTHPDIIRYFMTIPEAAQLVLQAGSMATGGDVFVLDMGKPVKILDLARRMVHLMGLSVQDEKNPEGDIEIQFTGLRPAEKLYEELLIGTDVSGTEHPRILRAAEEFIEPEDLNPLIDKLWESALALDTETARRLLLRVVSGYRPTGPIEDLVWVRRNRETAAEEAKVADISKYRDQT